MEGITVKLILFCVFLLFGVPLMIYSSIRDKRYRTIRMLNDNLDGDWYYDKQLKRYKDNMTDREWFI